MAERIVNIPEGVSVKAEGNSLVVRGRNSELRREFKNPKIKVEVRDGAVAFSSTEGRRKTLALLGTWAALLKNMAEGVSSGYEAKMKIVYSHFPVKFNVQADRMVIQNFLGEKRAREARIIPGTAVKVDKDIVTVTGTSKQDVGQTAANIELACKISGKDRRVFQDGCFITQKPVRLGAK